MQEIDRELFETPITDDLYMAAFIEVVGGIRPTHIDNLFGGRTNHFVYAMEHADKINELKNQFFSESVSLSLPLFRTKVTHYASWMKEHRYGD